MLHHIGQTTNDILHLIIWNIFFQSQCRRTFLDNRRLRVEGSNILIHTFNVFKKERMLKKKKTQKTSRTNRGGLRCCMFKVPGLHRFFVWWVLHRFMSYGPFTGLCLMGPSQVYVWWALHRFMSDRPFAGLYLMSSSQVYVWWPLHRFMSDEFFTG